MNVRAVFTAALALGLSGCTSQFSLGPAAWSAVPPAIPGFHAVPLGGGGFIEEPDPPAVPAETAIETVITGLEQAQKSPNSNQAVGAMSTLGIVILVILVLVLVGGGLGTGGPFGERALSAYGYGLHHGGIGAIVLVLASSSPSAPTRGGYDRLFRFHNADCGVGQPRRLESDARRKLRPDGGAKAQRRAPSLRG